MVGYGGIWWDMVGYGGIRWDTVGFMDMCIWHGAKGTYSSIPKVGVMLVSFRNRQKGVLSFDATHSNPEPSTTHVSEGVRLGASHT